MNLKYYDFKRPSFSPNHVDYLTLIREYHNLFGEENVLVLPFELFQTEPLVFTKQLADFLNIEINIPEERFKAFINNKADHFTRYHLRGLNRLRQSTSLNNHSSLYNRYTKRLGNSVVKLANTLIPNSWHKSTKQKIQTTVNTWVDNRYQANNKILAELINQDLSKYGYY